MAATEAKKAELKGRFRAMDKNGDNKLDFTEFLTLMPDLDTRTAHRLFDKVDKSGDGCIDFDEFVDYIYSADGRITQRTTAGRHARLAALNAVSIETEDEPLWATCEAVWETYAGSDKKFESKDFKKLCQDCKLFDRKFTRNDVDIVFTKYKGRGSNKLDFEAFKNCVRTVAQKKGIPTQAVQAAVAERDGLGTEQQATKADFVRFHDDRSSYTGTHTHNEFHSQRGASNSPDRLMHARQERIREEQAFDQGEGPELDWGLVQPAFTAFCKGDEFMDGKEFSQVCEDCELYIRRRFEQADADIIFNKVKNRGERKIDFDQFKDACMAVARKRGGTIAEVQTAIKEAGGPQLHGVTQADNVRFHDDKSLYTGMHAIAESF